MRSRKYPHFPFGLMKNIDCQISYLIDKISVCFGVLHNTILDREYFMNHIGPVLAYYQNASYTKGQLKYVAKTMWERLACNQPTVGAYEFQQFLLLYFVLFIIIILLLLLYYLFIYLLK